MVNLKRAYVKWAKDDGFRVLVDRLWPRGISKEEAHLDLWLKDIAPSTELRKWFGHDPKKWEGFREKYKRELKEKKQLINQLKALKKEHKTVTIVYGAKDTGHNEAVILEEFIR